jgi:hypothetical protein
LIEVLAFQEGPCSRRLVGWFGWLVGWLVGWFTEVVVLLYNMEERPASNMARMQMLQEIVWLVGLLKW